jgi:hypothetical protein
MALDPNISLGVRQMELANPLAQYGQIAQIQNAQNQNQLAQFQLGAAQRADLAAAAQNELYARHFDPTKGAVDVNAFVAEAAKRGQGGIIPGFLKTEAERKTAAATLKKTETEIDEKQFKLQQDKFNYGLKSLSDSPTPQDAIKKLNDGVTKGYFDFSTAAAEAQKLQSMTPEQYKQYRIEKVLGLVDAKDKLGFMLPKTRDRDIGGAIQTIQDNPMMPGYSMPVAGMAATPKTPTFAEQTGQGQLNLARAKFDFEKANPTLSIQEDPSGLLAVNMRTGVATPVVYGPMGIQAAPAAGTAPAPAAAPGASLMRQPPAALPGQRMPAIPGMASVLDQTGAPAAMPMPSTTGERVPGQPVTAKKALPEAYAKQAMGVANTNDSLEKLLSVMKNFKSSDMLNPTRRAELGQAHATTLLFAKELFNLGVLNGGDERIVNSVINNPVDFSSTAVPIEAIRKQARDLQGVVDRTNKNLSTVYKIPLLKLERSTPSGASVAESVDTSNPLLAN